MTSKDEVVAWATKITTRTDMTPFQMLGLLSSAGQDKIQEAFHRIARTSHPDLHRNVLSKDEFELVTRAYAKVAGAYQELRSGRYQAAAKAAAPAAPAGGVGARVAAVTPAGGAPAAVAGPAMNAKAQLYYRKAEMSLRKGELKTALLQLKMACAADPQSAALKQALAELQAELAAGG